jgi:hypothetical protein
MRNFKLIFISILFFLVAPFSIAQESSKVKIIDLAKLGDTLDKEKVEQYLNEIDEEVGKLIGQYPRLSDWKLNRKGKAWSGVGKKRTDTSIEYAHGLIPTASPNHLDWYGPEGFSLNVSVVTQKQYMMLQGASIDTIVFGAPLGNGCVIASATSANPKVPELDKKVSEIIKKRLSPQNCMFHGD